MRQAKGAVEKKMQEDITPTILQRPRNCKGWLLACYTTPSLSLSLSPSLSLSLSLSLSPSLSLSLSLSLPPSLSLSLSLSLSRSLSLSLPLPPGTQSPVRPETLHSRSRCEPSRTFPIGTIIVPFCGSYLGSYKALPKRNYFGAYGLLLKIKTLSYGHE